MVDIAQLVRAPLCGSGGRRFKSGYPPQIILQCTSLKLNFVLIARFSTHKVIQ